MEHSTVRARRARTMTNGAAERGGPIRVIVVDDHDLFRTGLASLLSQATGVEVVAQASTGRSGVRLAEELDPDVVLMDLQLPDLSGTEATREILQNRPSARVLVLTVAAGEADVTAAVQAGACGFLAKDTPLDDVVAAVRAAAHGAAWLSPLAADAVLGRLRLSQGEPDLGASQTAELSPRQLEVLRLIARGMENSEIAAELEISPRTAKNHVSSILEKLGLSNRIQAAIYAVRGGLD
jgi:two-component system NarL family response regulator